MSATAAPMAAAAAGSDSPDGLPLPSDETRWRYRMIAHADPGLLPRLVAPVAKLGLVPAHCGFTLRDDGLAAVDLAVEGLSRGQADHLRLVYSAMPAMRAVELARHGA
jgi:hypothetical protein